ncbi:MAG: aminotransferase class V-fold PLP-dependent enzyme [bacterium]|nr:aminotransferase class V-fold PLP-dependent enzyme [bacterium]
MSTDITFDNNNENDNIECIDQTQRETDFPILTREIDDNRLIYLDSAATSLKPRQVTDEVSRYYREISANIHRGKHYLSEESSTDFEEGRYKVAQFLRCAGNEVIFVRNTTEALNLAANGLGIGKDDTVVVCTDSHHSNYLPWVDRANTRLVRIGEQGTVDMDHYKELLQGNPKVVSLTHCSNVSGLYAPLEEMTRMAKEAGALVVVDAAQSVAHHRVNVAKLDIDFLAFSAHKMLGPTGIGVLYGKQALLENMKPLLLGGGMVDWVDTEGFRVRKIPHKFEAGTPHIAGVYGLTAAIRYLEKIGFDRLHAHDHALGQVLFAEAEKRDYLEVIAPSKTSRRCATISFRVKGADDLGNLARMLSDSYGIMCRSGHMCAQPYVDYFFDGGILRASAYLYNTRRDIADLFRALDELQHMF